MTASAERAGRLPDFFIVGHPKSGTTALYEMLRSHPQIFMPDLKEPRYFAPDLRARFVPSSTPEEMRLRLPETLPDYLALFAPAGPEQILGEASPSYLRSREAPALIAAAKPDARIIAILREPAGFLRSLHLELVQNHVESEQDLRRALEKEHEVAVPGAGGAAALPRYSDRVSYVEQLRRYRQAFPEQQLLVLIYDDFRAENLATLRRVLRFLGAAEDVPIAPVEANPTVHVRSLRADRFVRSLYAGRGPVGRVARSLAPRALRGERLHALRRRLLYGAPQPEDEELMRELRVRFKGEVQALSEYLGRDLVSLWGYDRLG